MKAIDAARDEGMPDTSARTRRQQVMRAAENVGLEMESILKGTSKKDVRQIYASLKPKKTQRWHSMNEMSTG